LCVDEGVHPVGHDPVQELRELLRRLESVAVDREEQPELRPSSRVGGSRPDRARRRRQAGPLAQRVAGGREDTLPQPAEDGLDHLLLGAKVMDQCRARNPEGGGKRPPRQLGEPVLDRVVNHRVEQLGPALMVDGTSRHRCLQVCVAV
jgi:hypothetical protein